MTIYLIVGLPGAGKTLRAKELEISGSALRLTPDDWQMAIFDGDDPTRWRSRERVDQRDRIEGKLVETGMRAAQLGVDVVFDFGFWSRDERSALRWIADTLGVRAEVVYLPIDLAEQSRRIARRFRTEPGQFLLTDVELAEWQGQFEAPDEAEVRGDVIPEPPTGTSDVVALGVRAVAVADDPLPAVNPTRDQRAIMAVMSDFDGRTVLVTGASGGIGGATVRRLVAAGAEVIAGGRSVEALAALAAETGCRTLSFDLTSEDSVRDALAGLDVYGVVNCGGNGGEIATPMETDIAVFDQVIAVNARGALLVTKYTSASMIRLGRGGSIVNVSSQASLVALRGHISYGSSKAALDNITRVSALELGKYGIRVNGVNPTVVMTPMSAWYWGREDVQGPFLEAMPLGRWATEDEIAGPIVFLLSDDASMISGVSLPIDGGFTAQ